MRIFEQSEVWEMDVPHDEDSFSFRFTDMILQEGEQFYKARSNQRQRFSSQIDLKNLDRRLIPRSYLHPIFQRHLTRAPVPLPKNCYIKGASLSSFFGFTASKDDPSVHALVLQEAGYYEILRAVPHPNIARYFGYSETLAERVAKKGSNIDAELILHGIQSGLDHLHGLGLIHCDINPRNILMDGDTPVIADFDSCAREGDPLGDKKGTPDWTDSSFVFARVENDEYGLQKIRITLLYVNSCPNKLSTGDMGAAILGLDEATPTSPTWIGSGTPSPKSSLLYAKDRQLIFGFQKSQRSLGDSISTLFGPSGRLDSPLQIMEQIEFHDPTSLPHRNWLEIEPKIHEMILNQDPASGRRTLLQRHQPGSLNAKESLHDYIEEIYIVEGDLGDKRTGETYKAGYYAYRKPGMMHGPFASERGCLMFITCTPV